MPVERKLVPIKLQYFFLSGASGCLIPFLPLYFKWIHFTATQSALIIAAMPFAAAVFNPLIGGVADKWMYHKMAITVCCALAALGQSGVQILPLALNHWNHTSNLSLACGATPSEEILEVPSNCALNTQNTVLEETMKSDSTVFTNVFLCLFTLEVISYGMSESSASLTDALTYDILGEDKKGDYGQQHVLAAIGYPVFSAVCGVLIDVTAKVSDNDVLTYLPLFSFYVFFMTCVCFNTCAISPSTSSQESSNFLKGIWEILKNLELVALFVTTVIYGILTGVSIAFLTWYLESLGALHTVIGTSTIMFCVFELPTLYKAGAIMDKLGMVNTMYLTYVIYALRFVGYGAMNTPWLIYAIEPLHGATSALMFTVTTAYAVSKSPSGFTATATGLTYGSQLLGRGVGSVVGGVVYDTYGPRILFYSSSTLSAFGLVLLMTFRLFITSCCTNQHQESAMSNDHTPGPLIVNVDETSPLLDSTDEA